MITFSIGEVIADEAQPAFGLEALAVEGDDAGRLLAAVLQGVKPQRCQGCGIGVAIDAEYAALLAQPVAVEVEFIAIGHWLTLCPNVGCWALPPYPR